MIQENRRRLLPPHPQKGHYFMVEISRVKEVSLLRSCLRKLTDLNFDKCSCSGVYDWVIFINIYIKNFRAFWL